jgi:peptide deformylase
MTILEILQYPNENLKKKAANVNKIDINIIKTANNMIDTMLLYKGIGLAATQVNFNKKIIVINANSNIMPLIIINPKIINKRGINAEIEGCLSFPNVFIKVKRNKIIKTKIYDINGKMHNIIADKLLSICIQHEIDHLNGITLYDKMSSLKKKLFKK